jgi:MoxR-like ATPase
MTLRPAQTSAVPVPDRLATALGELGRIVVGKQTPLRLALTCLLARGHLLIEDIPGVGKSTLAQALAGTLGLKYARSQFTSDLLPADVLGVSIFDPATHAFRFHSGPIFHSVVLADEINRAPPKTQSALMEAMEERQVSQDSETRKLPEPFFVIATQNPTEQIGAYPLPGVAARPLPDGDRARLSRSRLRARFAGVRRSPRAHPEADAVRRCSDDGALAARSRRRARGTGAARLRAGAASGIARHERRRAAPARRGLSPRASSARGRGVSRRALAGRPMVLPEDVQAVFPGVAGHRLAGSARAGGPQAQSLLRAVPLP